MDGGSADLVSVSNWETGLTLISVAVALVTAGATRYGHLLGKEWNPSNPGVAMQWCCPPTRQHAGIEDTLACVNGASRAVKMTSSTAMETRRLISTRILAHYPYVELTNSKLPFGMRLWALLGGRSPRP
jgi:hypothetical protein